MVQQSNSLSFVRKCIEFEQEPMDKKGLGERIASIVRGKDEERIEQELVIQY